jgi:hypothetical protein
MRNRNSSPGIDTEIKREEKLIMKIIKGLIVMTMAFCIVGFLSSAVFSEEIIPEMKECMRSHDSPEVYQRVLQKYCDPGIIRQAMGLLVIKEPYVMKTEIPSDVTQTYKVCWVNRRVISLEFLGRQIEERKKSFLK